MFAITGRIRTGVGAAGQTLAHQLPHIAKEFPEVASCHPATINVELDSPLLVLAPDHRTRPIAWLPGNPKHESFDLLRVELEAPADGPRVPAWIYISYASPHRRTPHMHEIITTKLDLAGVETCRLRINRSVVQMPWVQFPALVIV